MNALAGWVLVQIATQRYTMSLGTVAARARLTSLLTELLTSLTVEIRSPTRLL